MFFSQHILFIYQNILFIITALPLDVASTFGPAASTKSVYIAFSRMTHADLKNDTTMEGLRNVVIDQLHLALNTTTESLQEMTAAYLDSRGGGGSDGVE